MVSNHICPFEPIFLLYYTKASVLQRSEDSKVPIIGRVQKALQVLFVDRKSEESRKGIIKLINERSCESNLFPKMLIFPEGTCTNQSAIITFKNGPFHPGKTVQPILVRYMFRWMDPSFPAVSPSLRQLATRIACQVYNSMEIEFLDPYFPSSEEKVNAALYANNVRLLMAKKLGVPATHHAYEDAALQFEARACFPQHSMKEFIVEWGKVRKVLEIDSNSAKKYLRAFILLDKDKDGRLSYDEFVAAWRENNFEEQGSVVFANEKSSKNFSVPILPSGNDEMHLPVILSNEKQKDSKTAQKDGQSGVFEKELKRVFDLIDTDGYGCLDFRQFLTGLTILNGKGKEGKRGAFKFALDVLDMKGQRSFSIDEVEVLLRRIFPSLSATELKEALYEADINRSGVLNRDEFLSFAENHDQLLTIYSHWILNGITGQNLPPTESIVKWQHYSANLKSYEALNSSEDASE
eukprot:CAMPEP_0171453280 /NCGR_PEP_ID=MMETSP0945-20130129/1053_1 /TAXON_ID=109269 /ORGANISM="Vaucheria litorea, Strain CCMP2940" /LENGTH=464 /DNA_ID=CAMNT_0011978119 /DNA_START=518 /DNA_END=1909 /DNA_ORIENTATION=-